MAHQLEEFIEPEDKTGDADAHQPVRRTQGHGSKWDLQKREIDDAELQHGRNEDRQPGLLVGEEIEKGTSFGRATIKNVNQLEEDQCGVCHRLCVVEHPLAR